MAEELAAYNARSILIDLPGFGDSALTQAADVETTAAMIEETLAGILLPSDQYVLVGHSMGGKIAAILARRAAKRAESASRIRALVLISPSPPAPEPMQEAKRTEVTRELGTRDVEESARRAFASRFVIENIGNAHPEPALIRAEAERMMSSTPEAFRLWMQESSKYDVSDFVGTLQFPALLLAGSEDEALGPKAQQALTLPHLANASFVVLQGAGHLAPLERPAEVVLRMVLFLRTLGVTLEAPKAFSEPFLTVLQSDRTSTQTRAAMAGRLKPLGAPDTFDPELSVTLLALIQCVLPSAGLAVLDRLLQTLDGSVSDGWRFDTLPMDVSAWQHGLETLDRATVREYGVNFAALPTGVQLEVLGKAKAGDLGKGLLGTLHIGAAASDLSAKQMELWFEDVRAELAKLYASDPQTMDRIGFHGFADNGGFALVDAISAEGKEA